MGACASCRQPLYLVEASTNPRKPTTILRALAERAEVPAYLVLFSEGKGEVIGGRLLSPRRENPERSEAELRRDFLLIRKHHKENRCQAKS